SWDRGERFSETDARPDGVRSTADRPAEPCDAAHGRDRNGAAARDDELYEPWSVAALLDGARKHGELGDRPLSECRSLRVLVLGELRPVSTDYEPIRL